VRQSPQGLSCDIFDKHSQPEYAGIEMIRMPHVHSNISMSAKLGVINSQFYRLLRLCNCKKFFVFKVVNLIVFPKVKSYPSKILLKRTRGLPIKKFPVWNFWHFQNDFALGLVSGELLVSPLVHSLPLVSIPLVFLLPFLLVCVFLSCLYCLGLLRLLLAISMVKSSCCFWNCSKNPVCRWVLVNTFTHCR